MNYSKISSTIVASALALSFTACGGGDDAAPAATTTTATDYGTGTVTCSTISNTYNGNGKSYTELCTIAGTFKNQTLTLDATKAYRISGEVVIGGDNVNPATLSIPADTVAYGSTGDFILISRGSQIQASGTSTNPIILTSVEDFGNTATSADQGQWGGLAIAGNGQINKGTEEAFEFSSVGRLFGGTNDADNSGSITYMQIRYSGWQYLVNAEMQGLSLGGVGSGTTLSYIQVYNSSDDGIEIWGGKANLDHIVVTGAADDSIDTDHGYRGTLQYVYAEQNGTADHMLEADNEGANYNATPRSHPKISNFTFISTGGDDALKWKEGTQYTLVNGEVTITGAKGLIEMDTNATFVNFSENNASIIAGCDFSTSDNVLTSPTDSLTNGTDTITEYLEANAISSSITGTGKVTDNNATVTAVNPADYGFTGTTASSDYTDATGDWRSGWALQPDGTVYP